MTVWSPLSRRFHDGGLSCGFSSLMSKGRLLIFGLFTFLFFFPLVRVRVVVSGWLHVRTENEKFLVSFFVFCFFFKF